MSRGTTTPDPLPLDYAGPARRTGGDDGLTLHVAVSGLLVLGLGLFGGGLAALVSQADGWADVYLLAAGTALVAVVYFIRRWSK